MMTLFPIFLLICCIHDLNAQSRLCGNEYEPVVEICKVSTLTSHKLVYITTTGVPSFQQTFCECLITAQTSDVNISFSFVDGMVPQSLSFRVNDNEIQSGQQHTFTLEDRSLTLSVLTNDNYTHEAVCLVVSSETFFNVLCYRTSHHTTTSMTSSSLDPDSSSSVSTNKYIEKTTDKDNNHLLALIVLPVLGGSVIVILVIIFVICMKRHRAIKKQRPSTQSNKVSMTDLEPNTEQRECETNTYEIPDQNVYEGLDRQGNASPGDTYQHLYTETNNSHVESQYLNLSNPQSDINTLESEHKHTPGKGSFADGIHRKNSSNEYERYKANATDQMYEIPQPDD